jgi:hypothetical protein
VCSFFKISTEIFDFNRYVCFCFRKITLEHLGMIKAIFVRWRLVGNSIFCLRYLGYTFYSVSTLENALSWVGFLFDVLFYISHCSPSLLQINGIKTLVKSYLPFKDAHVRPDIDSLLDILRNMLSYGEISKDLQSRYISFRLQSYMFYCQFKYYVLICARMQSSW